MYHYVSQQKLLTPPAPVTAWFDTDKMRERYARFKQDFE
jgi:hypothetical protein